MNSQLVRLAVAVSVVGVVGVGVGVTSAQGTDPAPRTFTARLSGFNEDPAALSTDGSGHFRARIDEGKRTITYRLTYENLEGDVQQAHIHLGGKSQSGGISVFLCSNLGNGPAGTQKCPDPPAVVTGTIMAANVIGPTAQGIGAGQFTELVRAIKHDTTYTNVHSTLYPGGEIRGQLH